MENNRENKMEQRILKKNNYKVYVYTNKINGKKYVGQTCRTLKIRAGSKKGQGYKHCIRFYNAIQKYGIENFEAKILYDNLSLEEANKFEIKTISELKTTDSKYGYNICTGGEGAKNLSLMVPVVQFDKSFNCLNRYDSIKEASEANDIDLSKISLVCKHREGYYTAGGYIWLHENEYLSNRYNKEKILSLVNKEFEHPNARPVVQLDLQMNFIARFDNICKASKTTGVRRNGINYNCIHKLKTSGGYIWIYEEEYEEIRGNNSVINNIVKEAHTIHHQRKAVIQFDEDMNYIAEFESVLEASKKAKVDRKEINNVCKGIRKTANGYIWRYKELIPQ